MLSKRLLSNHCIAAEETMIKKLKVSLIFHSELGEIIFNSFKFLKLLFYINVKKIVLKV